MKVNSISKQEKEELEKKFCSGEKLTNYLKKLDSPIHIEQFINKIKQAVLKLKLSKQGNLTNDKGSNKWLLPTVILILSFLALTSLVLIIRRKRKRRGF